MIPEFSLPVLCSAKIRENLAYTINRLPSPDFSLCLCSLCRRLLGVDLLSVFIEADSGRRSSVAATFPGANTIKALVSTAVGAVGIDVRLAAVLGIVAAS